MTLGILGGLGPLVSAHFLSMLYDMTEAEGDGDYPDLLLSAMASTPDRTAHLLDGRAPDPTPALLGAAVTLLRGGAGVILPLCYTAHAFLPEVRARISVPILDLVSLGASAAHEAGVRRLGVLCSAGTVRARLFELAGSPYGMQILYPCPARQADLQRFIYATLKSGGAGDREILREAVADLAAQGAEAVLLGCTELSLPGAMPAVPLSLPCIDPLVLLAGRAIVLCGKKCKEAYHHAAWRPAIGALPRAFTVGTSFG